MCPTTRRVPALASCTRACVHIYVPVLLFARMSASYAMQFRHGYAASAGWDTKFPTTRFEQGTDGKRRHVKPTAADMAPLKQACAARLSSADSAKWSQVSACTLASKHAAAY